MSRRWQEMLAWVAGIVVPLLVLATVFITVLELERIRRHQPGVSKVGGIDTAMSLHLVKIRRADR